MRIGVFVGGPLNLEHGKVYTFINSLVNAMHLRGHFVGIISQEKSDVKGASLFPFHKKMTYVNLTLTDSNSLVDARIKICAQNFDVICAAYADDSLLWLCSLLYNTGIPLIISEQEHPEKMDTVCWNRYERLGCMAGADAVHMLVERFKENLPFVLQEKVVVIPNSISSLALPVSQREHASRKTILAVGTLLDSEKQFSILINAFSLLAAKFQDWDLQICGSRLDENSYRQLTAQLGIAHRVYWHSNVENIDSCYAKANIFCIPSQYDGCSLELLEAQRHGVPCVGFSACAEVNEIILDGKNGLLAPHISAQSLATTLGVVMGKESLRTLFGENAIKMLSRFSEKKVFDKWELLFNTIAQQKNATKLMQEMPSEDVLAKNALLEILARPTPIARPDYLRRQKRKIEDNASMERLVSKQKQVEPPKDLLTIGAELAKDFQLFPYPYPASQSSYGIKRVTLFLSGLESNETNQQVVTLARTYKVQGFDVSVVCYSLDGHCTHSLSLLQEQGISVFSVYQAQYLNVGKRILKDRIVKMGAQWYKTIDKYENFCALAGILAHLRPDVLHCYHDDANCMGGIAGVLLGIPRVILSGGSASRSKHEIQTHETSWIKNLYCWLLEAPQVCLEANFPHGFDQYMGVDGDDYSECSSRSKHFAGKNFELPEDDRICLSTSIDNQTKHPFDLLKIAQQVVSKQTETVTSITVENEKPRVLILADTPEWAYDISARALQQSLANTFLIDIAYVSEKPDLSRYDFDLLHVCWWGEAHHLPYVKEPKRVVKEISSHRWQEVGRYGPLEPDAFCKQYLSDAGFLVATSRRLQALVNSVRPCGYTPNGFDTRFNLDSPKKHKGLHFGWAGRISDPCKGFHDILLPASSGVCPLQVAPGNLSIPEMVDFYANIDILCIASTFEGEPLTLIEAMAMGCFPIATDVGIVPELIRNGKNGLIVERTPKAFREAFRWCLEHKDAVKAAGEYNRDLVYKTRTWNITKNAWCNVWNEALSVLK